eukprot:Lithocolla_globosa_v1_NODE_954_length_3037_cov_9.991952.p4 type:complete len:113 gc:universal NODE_954_length_3037_cov_9.991952:1421-1083(-)
MVSKSSKTSRISSNELPPSSPVSRTKLSTESSPAFLFLELEVTETITTFPTGTPSDAAKLAWKAAWSKVVRFPWTTTTNSAAPEGTKALAYVISNSAVVVLAHNRKVFPLIL